MTVIVADARLGLIGSDRFCSSGYYSRKVYKTKTKGIFACAGDDRAIARFEAWMLNSKAKRPTQIDSEEEFEALQLYRGHVFLWELAMRPTLIDTGYFCIGSGGKYCLGAMDAGADMFQALVLATARTDGAKPPFEYMDEAGNIYTGEPVPSQTTMETE